MPTAPSTSVTRYKGVMTKWPTLQEFANAFATEESVTLLCRREDHKFPTRLDVEVLGLERDSSSGLILLKLKPTRLPNTTIDDFVMWFDSEVNHLTLAVSK